VMDGDRVSFDLLKGEIHWQSADTDIHNDGHADGRAFPAFNGKEIYLREFSDNTTQAHQGCVSKQVISQCEK